MPIYNLYDENSMVIWLYGLTGFWAKYWMDGVDQMDGWMNTG